MGCRMSACEQATSIGDAIWLSVMFIGWFGVIGFIIWLAATR